MINDVLQACHKLNVKAIKALDFIDKWAAYLKRTQPLEFDDLDYESMDEDSGDQYALIRFSKEVKRKPNKKELSAEAASKPCK